MVALSISTLYNNTKAILKTHGIENYRGEAAYLIKAVYGFNKHELAILGHLISTSDKIEKLNELIIRRKRGEPLQYLLGEWEFYGYNFSVGDGVLIPRQDTETLIEVVLEEMKQTETPKIVDLCSGSGCVAITLEKIVNNADVFAIELSDQAFPYLMKNISDNNSNITAIIGDVSDKAIVDALPLMDCVISNPPYLTPDDMQKLQLEVQYEPKMALEGGDDGLFFYREISSIWKNKLKPNGLIAFEIGLNQELSVEKILKENDFQNIQFKKDLCGIIRVVHARII